MAAEGAQITISNNSNHVENPEVVDSPDDPRKAYNMPPLEIPDKKMSPRDELRRMKPASGRAHVNKTPPNLPTTSMKKHLELRQLKAPLQLSSDLPYEREED